MLTDDELTTRLGAALRETVSEIEYGGRVPRVRHHGGLATTSVLAAAAALALVPVAVEQGHDRAPHAVPSLGPHTHRPPPAGRTTIHTVDFGTLRLSYASVDGLPGPLYFVGGPDLRLPADAEKLDLGLRVDIWYVPDAAAGDPDLYLRPRGGCPSTQEGCTPGDTPPLYGLLAAGWTRPQLVGLLEHPVEVQGGRG
jgi:hypothetical protein